MIKEYKKGYNFEVGSKHFTSKDFDCHCNNPKCSKTLIDDEFGQLLDELWRIAGSFSISSGYRCATHNAAVGGVENSYHTKGMACDCKSLIGLSGYAMGRHAEQITRLAEGGIGLYLGFCHIDIRTTAARWGFLTKC